MTDMNTKKNFVTYEEFGAVGDGVTDDMPAIVACHDYANAHHLPVVARDGAEYYIGGKDITAKIMTSTHWGKAKFTIDDRRLENVKVSCFLVVSANERFPVEIPSLCHNQKALDLPHEGNLYVRVFSAKRRVYVRKGVNQNNGNEASDCFLLDAEGNIQSGINWDYDEITSAYAVSADDEPIVLEGGIFTTIANEWESVYNYHSRNIEVLRSNVTIRELTHYVTGEGGHGAPYSGFLAATECANLTIEDCLLTPHKTYPTAGKLPGSISYMGSYDLSLHAVINAHIRRVSQTIDIRNTAYWGLMGSNFSKEIHLEDCTVSRFDAHCGVTNGSIRRCTLGHMGVNLIGFGEFLIEDTTVYCTRLVHFRDDYGAFFHGKLTLRRCTLVPTGKLSSPVPIFRAKNTGDHDFGYPCGMPETIVVDGLTIKDRDVPGDHSYVLFSSYDPHVDEDKPYPYETPKHLTASVTVESGRSIALAADLRAFPHLRESDMTVTTNA